MQSRVVRIGVALGALALLVVCLFSVASAAEAPGYAPENALKAGESIILEPGVSTWYSFNYNFVPDTECTDECDHECRDQSGHDVSKDCRKDCHKTCHVNHMTVEPMLIELFSSPKASNVSFCVMTAENVKVWKETGKLVCTGQGTNDKMLRSQLSWTGLFFGRGQYYVYVSNPATAKAPVSATLKIGGSGVTP